MENLIILIDKKLQPQMLRSVVTFFLLFLNVWDVFVGFCYNFKAYTSTDVSTLLNAFV